MLGPRRSYEFSLGQEVMNTESETAKALGSILQLPAPIAMHTLLPSDFSFKPNHLEDLEAYYGNNEWL